MKLFTWAVRLVIFLILFVFALQNTEPVSLRLLFGPVWQAPLVIALLLFFGGGALFGIFSLLSLVFRQRREITRLKGELGRLASPADTRPPPTA